VNSVRQPVLLAKKMSKVEGKVVSTALRGTCGMSGGIGCDRVHVLPIISPAVYLHAEERPWRGESDDGLSKVPSERLSRL
jgi:hypothetical protein